MCSLRNTYDGQRLIRNELRYRISHECFLFCPVNSIIILRIYTGVDLHDYIQNQVNVNISKCK